MPFCHAPWTNLDISPQGQLSPCCKFRHGHYRDAALNITHHSISDYQHSATLLQIRQEFTQGQWPAGCERCRIEEENGVASKRQLDYQRWQSYLDANGTEPKTITASIAFGNTCNLTCLTCNAYTSSRWQREYQSLTGLDIKPNHFYQQGFVKDFLAHAPSLKHLDVPGGEPFLSGVPEQQALLTHYVDTGQAADISLHYTTNATVWPDQRWWQLWRYFKEVDIQLSIDGIGARYEYLRYPARWPEVTANINGYLKRQQDNIRLSVSHTVSAYNIRYLCEFMNWCSSQGLPKPWLGRVHDPACMRPTVWPTLVREHIADVLSDSTDPDILAWCQLVRHTDDSVHYKEFVERVHWHDQYRDNSFAATFPEMFQFL